MRTNQLLLVIVSAVLLLVSVAPGEAKRRKHKGSGDDYHHHHHDKTKTKTKWSTSTNLAGNTQVSTEEHGYYVKRTYAPLDDAAKKRQSPPYLAIPIAWFQCEGNCHMSNSAAINSAAQSLSEGYLCDDDCTDLYEPICGKTSTEVAVFYNKCKLNVAKCRSHGLWTDFDYEQCQQAYPKETAYTDKKFKCSPYYRDNATQAEATEPSEQKDKEKDHSSESSEEKVEKVEPLVVPLTQASAPVPISVPVERIALPPMPMKLPVPTRTPPMIVPTTLDEVMAKVTEAKPVTTAPLAQIQVEHTLPRANQDKLRYLVN